MLERVKDDTDLQKVITRLLRANRGTPLGERKFALFGIGKVFETFETKALPFADPVAHFVVARLGDAETLSDSTYCQVICRCCTEVAGVCTSEEIQNVHTGNFALSSGNRSGQPKIQNIDSFASASALLGRSWAPDDKDTWFQPTTALARSACSVSSGRLSSRVPSLTCSHFAALSTFINVLAKAALHSDCVTQQNAAEALQAVLRTIPEDSLTDDGLNRLYKAIFSECAKKHDGVGRKYSQQLFLLLATLVLRFGVVPPANAKFGDLLEWGASAREAVVREAAFKFAEALL